MPMLSLNGIISDDNGEEDEDEEIDVKTTLSLKQQGYPFLG